MTLDLHTHLPGPKPEAIISCSPPELPAPGEWPGQLYSTGIHPWDLTAEGLSETDLAILRNAALREDVVAIGECGIDLAKPGAAPLFIQMLALKVHIALSEEIGKPLILHCVKGFDIIIGLRKEFRPAQRWIIHGFRGKPTVAEMLLRAGLDLSFGEKFNPQSVAITPADRLFSETDESALPISEIIQSLSLANPEINSGVIASNIRNLLG